MTTDPVAYRVLNVIGATTAEGDTGTLTAPFTLKLAHPSTSTVLASWATTNGTATSGADYTAASGTVNFAPGETSKIVSVTVTGDTTKEPNETVILNITSLTGAGALKGTSSPITIKNDD